MKVISEKVVINTKREGEMIDITKDVQQILNSTDIYNGIVTLFVTGSTGALTTIEYESGLIFDFPTMLERIAPKDISYEHEKRWHDGNGHSHVRASLIGPSLIVPFNNQKLTLGTWQQIVLIEFDIRSRKREVVLQIIGE